MGGGQGVSHLKLPGGPTFPVLGITEWPHADAYGDGGAIRATLLLLGAGGTGARGLNLWIRPPHIRRARSRHHPVHRSAPLASF
eukprot:6875055-Pyramimonas_sp.AAC.2